MPIGPHVQIGVSDPERYRAVAVLYQPEAAGDQRP
jgi:hypothetical protein